MSIEGDYDGRKREIGEKQWQAVCRANLYISAGTDLYGTVGRRCFVLGELQRQKVEVRMSSLSVVYYAMRWLSISFSVAPRAVHLEIE